MTHLNCGLCQFAGLQQSFASKDEGRNTLARKGIFRLLAETLHLHTADADVQIACLRCVRLLTLGHHDNVNKLYSVGGVGLCLAAMASHPKDFAVQAWACAVLRGLAWGGPSYQVTIARAGGIAAVLRVLRQELFDAEGKEAQTLNLQLSQKSHVNAVPLRSAANGPPSLDSQQTNQFFCGTVVSAAGDVGEAASTIAAAVAHAVPLHEHGHVDSIPSCTMNDEFDLSVRPLSAIVVLEQALGALQNLAAAGENKLSFVRLGGLGIVIRTLVWVCDGGYSSTVLVTGLKVCGIFTIVGSSLVCCELYVLNRSMLTLWRTYVLAGPVQCGLRSP